MALSKALANARHSNRVRQLAAELAADQKIRLDHAGDLIAGYVESDKVTDEQFVTAARNLHRLLETEEQRTALYILVATWQKEEAQEERSVGAMSDHNIVMVAAHRRATPVWVDGSWVPGGSGDAA